LTGATFCVIDFCFKQKENLFCYHNPSMRQRFGGLLGEAWGSLFFLGRLPFHLMRPLHHDQLPSVLAQRLEGRESAFAALVERIFSSPPGNTYKRLFSWAGVKEEDVRILLRREGVEGTLRRLLREGIYLTPEEFKGRRSVRRGNREIAVRPDMFLSPVILSRFNIQTSGSSGRRSPVPLTLDYIKSRSVDAYCDLRAKRGLNWVQGLWGVPGSSAIVYLLEMAGLGLRPVRWFSQINPASPGLHARYRWSSRGLRALSLLAGVPLPRPDYVSVWNPEPIISWLKNVLQEHAAPHLFTYVSSALRLSDAAQRVGVDLSGAKMTVTGEPLTEIRARAIRGSGLTVYPRYGSAESGTIGYGCLKPGYVDEVHVLTDRLAVVQTGRIKKDIPADALFVTSLEPASPYLLFNVALGDGAVLSRRDCRCPLQSLGWTAHLHTIRSYGKLTSEGMSLLCHDLERILDVMLPATLGGRPGDYQLIEDMTEAGRPVVRLLVHPGVGRIDPQGVRSFFLDAVGRSGEAQKLMSLLWKDARTVRVEQRAPLQTASGKILPWHRRLVPPETASRGD
jgi:hypothetical protein